MKVVTRFAPSPTGYLHIGGLRTALLAWLFARSHNGKYILRIDDTDSERSQQIYTDAIKEDLQWLGLTWDMEVVQSDRMHHYEAAKRRLLDQGDIYPCFESQEELQLKKKMQLSSNKPPIYDRQSLNLTSDQQKDLIRQGIGPYYRFLLKDGHVRWNDLVRGEINFESKNLSDPVLIRADGSMTYSIASVMDDIDLGITHIIRAEDHITNSALHIQMFQALGARVPEFAHLSLMRNQVGGKMSKRDGGFSVRDLRSAGIEPMALLSLLAKMGTSDSVEVAGSLEELVAHFSVAKQSRAAATYSADELMRLNTQVVHRKEFSSAQAQLKQLDMDDMDEPFWNAIRGNLTTVAEAKVWYDICRKPLEPIGQDLEFTSKAAELLPEAEGWSINTWSEWIALVQKATRRSGKDLFMPIRRTLTGLDHGPELKFVLALLGRERSYNRLMGIRS